MPNDSPAAPIGQQIDYNKFLDCVHCGLCTSACPTYLETGNENDSPRGRIYLMRAVVDGRYPLTDTIQKHLDLCLDCRSCETACPSGVQYGRLIEPFRVETIQHERAQGKKPGWFQRLFLYGLFPYPGRMKWSLLPARWMQRLGLDKLMEKSGLLKLLPTPLQRANRLLPRLSPAPQPLPEVLPAIGPKRARVGLFTGCVAEAMFAETNRATARVLQQNGCEVVIPRAQQCCGAIHYHSGAAEPAIRLARANFAAFPLADLDAVIINVAGCGSMLKDYGHMAHEALPHDEATVKQLEAFAGKVQDIAEFLMKLGPVKPQGSLPIKATYHDACHLVHAQKIRQPPRQLLGLIPDLKLVPLTESDICCGAAGSYNLTQPDMADRLALRKVEHIRATGAEAVIMGNAGCSLQIQSTLREQGLDLPVLHPVDLLDLSYRGIDWSEYRKSRA